MGRHVDARRARVSRHCLSVIITIGAGGTRSPALPQHLTPRGAMHCVIRLPALGHN